MGPVGSWRLVFTVAVEKMVPYTICLMKSPRIGRVNVESLRKHDLKQCINAFYARQNGFLLRCNMRDAGNFRHLAFITTASAFQNAVKSVTFVALQ